MDGVAAFIDGSAYAASVCDHAAWAAERLEEPLTLVHSLGKADASSAPADLSGALRLGARRALLEKLAAHDAERAALARERGRALLDDARARVLATADVEAKTRLLRGDPVEALQEMERDAPPPRLLVIGKRGEDASPAMEHLGSNLDRLVRASRGPTLIASRAFRPVARVLIAFDGGPSATRAVERIAASPLLAGAACHLLSAAGAGETALGAAAESLRAGGFDTTEHRLPDPPESAVPALLKEIEADLLALGKSGHSRLHQAFVGSTTLELMRTCQAPVLIFP